jgi:hypothetical protein
VIAVSPAQWSRPARTRVALDTLAIGVPLTLLAAAVTWRIGGAAVIVALLALAATATAALWRARRFDGRWVVRGLDERRGDVEDSADLIFADDARLTAMQRLQRARVLERLATDAGADLRPGWSTGAIVAACAASAFGIAAMLLIPPGPPEPLAPSSEGLPAVAGIPRLTGQRLRIVPPAYTGLPPRDLATLDARAPEGSRLQWTLRFAPQPGRATLAFAQGGDVPLRQAQDWRAALTLTRSALYRVAPAGSDRPGPLHRLDAIPDTPPRVAAAGRTLTIVTPGQRGWIPTFTATDDYGVSTNASLRITLAQGEGEQVTFRERTIPLRGTGPARGRRFAAALDFATLGFAKGGDLIVQLTVADTAPRPHVVRGPSLILRWPGDKGELAAGLDGAVKKAMPAYFRSQRQIIIDAEALIKVRRTITADDFAKRSDAIGVDQRMLRMRYGQFMGEESEGPSIALPTSDAEAPVAGAVPQTTTPAPAEPAAGHDEDVLAEYGHTHDESEAATLLDPQTRKTLRLALDQMWQSELHLRQGDPAGALPPANRALVFIKRVQQATRIFLARTGSVQPAIEESRRMTGKREGLAGGTLTLVPPPPVGAEPGATWRALATGPVAMGGLDRWLGGASVPDRLGLAAAIDAVRRAPDCVRCRADLRAQLWRAMPRPIPRVARRDGGDAQGRRYLDAIGR